MTIKTFARSSLGWAGYCLLATGCLMPAARAADRPAALNGTIKVASATFDAPNFSGTMLEHPASAVAEDGSFVTVWQNSQGAGGIAGTDLYAQRFNAQGARIGSTVLVNDVLSAGSGIFNGPASVVTDATGNFLVTWDQYTFDTTSGQYFYTSRARRFTSSGVPRAASFCADPACPATLAGDGYSAAMAADGSFVLSGLARNNTNNKVNVVFRRFAADGTALDAQPVAVISNSTLPNFGRVAINRTTGDFTVWWYNVSRFTLNLGYPKEWDTRSLNARRYNASGKAQGSTMNIASCKAYYSGGIFKSGCDIENGRLLLDGVGNHSFLWTQFNASGNPTETYLSRYNADGTANGTMSAIDQQQRIPLGIGESSTGDLLIGWNDGTGQSYAAAGSPIGSAFALPADGASLFNLNSNPAGIAVGSSVLSATLPDGSLTSTIEVQGFQIP